MAGRAGGLTLEPAVGVTSRELHERHGSRPATDEAFGRTFGHLAGDGEG